MMDYDACKTKDLQPGQYTVKAYEPMKSNYGVSYIITAENELTQQSVTFWANGYLRDFISSRKPTRKFKMEYVNSKITIPGYSKYVTLN